MSPLWRRIFWANVVFWGGLNAAWWFYIQFLNDHQTVWNFIFNAVYGIPYLLAGGFLFLMVWEWRRERYPDTTALVLLSLSMVTYAIAQFMWTYYNLNANIDVPSPAPPDIFYVLSFVLQIVAFTILMFHRKQERPLSRWVGRLSVAATVVFVLAATAFIFYSAALPNTLLTLDALYVSTSIVIVFLTLLNMHRDWHVELRLFLFVNMLGSAAGGFANLLYAVEINGNSYWNGDLADGLFAVSGLLFLLSCFWLPRRLQHAKSLQEPEGSLARLDLLLPAAVLILGLLIASRGAEYVYEHGADTLQQQTDLETAQAGEILQESIDQQMIQLNALAGLFEGAQTVTNDDFTTFAAGMRQSVPDISSLAYVNANGVIQFATDPSTVGKDISSDDARDSLLQRVSETDAVVASEPVVRLTGEPGVVLYQSIKKNGKLLGTITAAIRLPDLMKNVGTALVQPGFDFVLASPLHVIGLDGTTVYDQNGKFAFGKTAGVYPGTVIPPNINTVFPLTVADETWTLTSWPNAGGFQGTETATLLTFLAITLIDVVLAAIIYLLLAQQSKLRRDLFSKTRSLRDHVDQLAKYKFYLDNVSEAVVVSNDRGKIIYANRAVETVSPFIAASLAGRQLLAFLSGDAPGMPEIERMVAANGRWEGELPFRGMNGGKGDLALTIRSLIDDEGKRLGMLLVARDITERKNSERTKTQFVSLVSHQLRTPMTQLRWLVEQMLDEKRLSKTTKASLEDMEKIIQSENQLVSDLLNVSRIERGVLKLNQSTVRVSNLIAETIRPLERLAADAGVDLVTNDLTHDAELFVDEGKASEALRNLVDNSIKFSLKGGKVRIETSKKGVDVCVTVEDQGPGIPEEMWDTLFDVKTTATTSSLAGAGLGLFLTKKFLDAMGGRISFTSSSSGTIFTVCFPVAKPSGAGKSSKRV